MTEADREGRWLNKNELMAATGINNYYVSKAVRELKIRPVVRIGRGNERLFSEEQVRAIVHYVEELLAQK